MSVLDHLLSNNTSHNVIRSGSFLRVEPWLRSSSCPSLICWFDSEVELILLVVKSFWQERSGFPATSVRCSLGHTVGSVCWRSVCWRSFTGVCDTSDERGFKAGLGLGLLLHVPWGSVEAALFNVLHSVLQCWSSSFWPNLIRFFSALTHLSSGLYAVVSTTDTVCGQSGSGGGQGAALYAWVMSL